MSTKKYIFGRSVLLNEYKPTSNELLITTSEFALNPSRYLNYATGCMRPFMISYRGRPTHAVIPFSMLKDEDYGVEIIEGCITEIEKKGAK